MKCARVVRPHPNPAWPICWRGGATPILPPVELQEIGYKIAAYPLTLQLAYLPMVARVLDDLRDGRVPEGLASFDDLKEVVGFPAYNEEAEKYKAG